MFQSLQIHEASRDCGWYFSLEEQIRLGGESRRNQGSTPVTSYPTDG
jgi:hypothetical protein